MTLPCAIAWFRRDLRLSDHPMLAAAADGGRPVLPLFILDPETEALGAAPKWRLGLALAELATSLERRGMRLVLRPGPALAVLRGLVAETGAAAVHWTRAYDAASRSRDTVVKAALRADGVEPISHPGFLLHEPWQVETGQGGCYRVYTPFWKAVKDRAVAPLLHEPRLVAPAVWPASDTLQNWRLGAAMNRGADICARYQAVGEEAAQERLRSFIATRVQDYRSARDFPAMDATSRLSENLTYGEISPRAIWHAGFRAMHEGSAGAEHFLKELVWREFAWHLTYHYPSLSKENWREGWESFPWRGESEAAERWRRGMTGEPFVDAAMREMYVTGTMHNRARMIAASYLTKHLLTDWRIGLRWFQECLTDWDPAANAMGWQWVAGCGPDAAPYFRIFNPAGQAEKFDASGAYLHRFVAELSPKPGTEAREYFDAVPRRWGLDLGRPYPPPLIALDEGRRRALAAYEKRNA